MKLKALSILMVAVLAGISLAGNAFAVSDREAQALIAKMHQSVGETYLPDQLAAGKNTLAKGQWLRLGKEFAGADTIYDIVQKVCSKDYTAQVLGDNGISWEQAKRLDAGFEFFIRREFLKDEFRHSVEVKIQQADELAALRQQVAALQAQLADQQAVHQDQIAALTEERDSAQGELVVAKSSLDGLADDVAAMREFFEKRLNSLSEQMAEFLARSENTDAGEKTYPTAKAGWQVSQGSEPVRLMQCHDSFLVSDTRTRTVVPDQYQLDNRAAHQSAGKYHLAKNVAASVVSDTFGGSGIYGDNFTFFPIRVVSNECLLFGSNCQNQVVNFGALWEGGQGTVYSVSTLKSRVRNGPECWHCQGVI